MKQFLVTLAAVSVAVPALAQTTLPNLLPTGVGTVYVLDDAGTETRGTLLRIDPDAIVVATDAGERRFEAVRVKRIQKRGDSLRNGAIIGAVLGAVMSALTAGISDCSGNDPGGSCPGSRAAIFILGIGIYSAIGTGIDALITGRTTLYEAPKPAKSSGDGSVAFNLRVRW